MSDECAPLLDLPAIRTKAQECARLMGLREIVVRAGPHGDGSPYVEVSDAYHFVVEERGVELLRRETADLNELLYWICDVATFAVASDHAASNRNPKEDFRRKMFARHEQLLGRVSEYWKLRKVAEHQHILERRPFADGSG